MAEQSTGWEGILDAGERIIWQGRPDPSFHVSPKKLFPTLFGLGFAGFALFWMAMAAQSGGGFWMFGLIHFSVGLWLTGNSLFGESLRHRRTWYTLTDKRAFIATDFPWKGRQLDSYALTPATRLSLRGGLPGSVIFAREERRGNKGRRYMVDIGFHRIGDAEKVYELMRGVQRAHGAEAEA